MLVETTGVITIIVAILDLIAIVSVLGGTSTPGRKLLWIVVIILLPLLGLILYYLLGRTPEDM
ncbi:MAG: PLDc N-terminal domain-containing protein [Pseudomonadales bacterium]|nr:PLDc N-terminal domain-containing protein [Pseudomonadales bacterium]